MTPEKKAKQLAKRVRRTQVNRVMKGLKGEQRQRLLAHQGQQCVMMEKYAAEQNLPVDYDGIFNEPPSQYQAAPHLVWLNGKVYKQALGGRKNRPSNKAANLEAFAENASRDFAKQVDIALNPPAVTPEA